MSINQGDGGTALPSSERVLGELEALRNGSGISPRRIREIAPGLMSLPIVHDQLRLTALDPSDLHIAAYRAIGCIIDHSIDNFTSQRLLIWTLRYDFSMLSLAADSSWNRVRSASTLADRNKVVQSLLYLGRSTYYSQLSEAYQELADQLVLRAVSPCRDRDAELSGQILARASLRELLLMFSTEGRELLREVIAETALEKLGATVRPPRPKDVAFTERADGDPFGLLSGGFADAQTHLRYAIGVAALGERRRYAKLLRMNSTRIGRRKSILKRRGRSSISMLHVNDTLELIDVHNASKFVDLIIRYGSRSGKRSLRKKSFEVIASYERIAATLERYFQQARIGR